MSARQINSPPPRAGEVPAQRAEGNVAGSLIERVNDEAPSFAFGDSAPGNGGAGL
jgi:hypothetical protein